MSRFAALSLALLFAWPQSSLPAEEAEPQSPIATIFGEPVFSEQLDPSDARRQQAAQDIPAEQYRDWLLWMRQQQLTQRIMTELTARFCQSRDCEPTPEEMTAFTESMADLTESRRAAIEEELKQEQSEAVRPEMEADTARAFIKRWKVNKALYEEYGGRIIFQQAGIEPLDAYRAWLEEHERQGDFEIFDEQLREQFWQYFTSEQHTFIEAEEIQQETGLQHPFERPWWSREPQAAASEIEAPTHAQQDPRWNRLVEGGLGDPLRLMFGPFAEFQGQLYAGAFHPAKGCEIWRTMDGHVWEAVAGPETAVGSGFGNPRNEQITLLKPIGEWLYAGTWNTEQGGELWRSADGLQWEALVGAASSSLNGFGQAGTGIIALERFQGRLFSATGSHKQHRAELWMSRDDGRTWEGIAGERVALRLALGKESSYLQGLTVFREALYVMVGNPETGSEIWRTDNGVVWEAVVGSPSRYGAGLNNPDWDMIYSTTVFRGGLYVTVTNFTHRAEGALWRSHDGIVWEVIPVETDAEGHEQYGFSNIVEFDGALYVSSTPTAGASPHLWRSDDGQRWERVTSDATFQGRSMISAMRSFHGHLYVALGTHRQSAAEVGGEIWRFSPDEAPVELSAEAPAETIAPSTETIEPSR